MYGPGIFQLDTFFWGIRTGTELAVVGSIAEEPSFVKALAPSWNRNAAGVQGHRNPSCQSLQSRVKEGAITRVLEPTIVQLEEGTLGH